MRLRIDSSSPEVGQTIAAASGAIEVWVRPVMRRLDRACLEHALDRTLERAGAHADSISGEVHDLPHDPISMLLLIGQVEKDIEDRGGQRMMDSLSVQHP